MPTLAEILNFIKAAKKGASTKISDLINQEPQQLSMEGRANFLPYQDTLPGSVMNQRSWALPGIAAGGINAITAPRRAMQGGYEADEAGNITPTFNAPEEAMNVATNMMGGGIGASRVAPPPAGSLGMNVAPKITKKTKEFFAEGDLPKPKENHVRIFRGSWQTEPKYIVEENPKHDVYGGVFGSSGLNAAKSHGNEGLHYTDIPQNKILTHYDLNYEIPYEKTKAALLKAQPHLADDPELFDNVYKIVVEDAGQDLRNVNDDLINKAFGPYGPEVENEVQRIRGQVSKNLGYQAVEMVDEHGGGTYLISPGAEFKTMENIPKNPSTFDQGIDAAMNFGPAVLGSLRQVGSKIYNDATGHFVEYVKTPKISGYRIGEKGTFEGKPDPSFDQYLGDWLKPPYQTEQKAWAAIPQILKQEQKTTALKKYSNIPNHWNGVDKTIAKTLVDEFGPESINFISSARSSSKYINTPYGKIRISDHTLPGQYEDAALDLNRSMNKKDLLEQIKKFSNPE